MVALTKHRASIDIRMAPDSAFCSGAKRIAPHAPCGHVAEPLDLTPRPDRRGKQPMESITPQRFHYEQFADINALVALKKSQRISVCIPTLNEADTIGSIVSIIRETLVRSSGFVDEILVIDSGSQDATREIAAAAGATVHLASEILLGGDAPTANAHSWGSCVDLRAGPCRPTPWTAVLTLFPSAARVVMGPTDARCDVWRPSG